MKSLETPVAFFIFNRPDTTLRVFEEIRKARPPLLLVVADGPRKGHPNDSEQCAKARAILEQVDWDCEIQKNYSEVNLGCGQRVSNGLDWVFQKAEQAIILEDDCVPHPSFFYFCEEMLRKFKDDDRIGHIGGVNLQFGRKRTDYSYYFSRYHHVWGWASWRRAWKNYDPHMGLWPEVRDGKWLRDLLRDRALFAYWWNIFEKVYQHKIDTWAYQWTLHGWIYDRLAILPNVNLISNIGFDERATHTVRWNRFHNMKMEPIVFPLFHPRYIIRDSLADQYTEAYHFGVKFPLSLFYRLKSFFYGI